MKQQETEHQGKSHVDHSSKLNHNLQMSSKSPFNLSHQKKVSFWMINNAVYFPTGKAFV